MSVHTPSWEHRLNGWAEEALDSYASVEPPAVERHHLRRSYRYATALTRRHSRTFSLASGLLPPAKRRAVRALYAFCRVSDDLVDEGSANPLRALAQWRVRALVGRPQPDDLVAVAWADTRARYSIPRRYAEQLLDGVGRDIVTTRYTTFDDLAAYCYGVASTVGLMAMHIVGFAGSHAIPYAVKLGVALQITNILRDVGEDWRMGRLYLPLEELAAFGLGELDIAASVARSEEGSPGAERERVTPQWAEFMRFQIARNRMLYEEALPGIALLHPDGRFAIGGAAELYRAILDDIEEHNYDVFGRRAHTQAWEKVRSLPGIWWRACVRGYDDEAPRRWERRHCRVKDRDPERCL
jgi:phytoene synthase